MAPLKVFAFDYVTEGGPTARPLPHAFTQQGAMLFDALLADLGAVPGVEVCTMATLDAAGKPPAARSFASCWGARPVRCGSREAS
jgi:hypothetical protein